MSEKTKAYAKELVEKMTVEEKLWQMLQNIALRPGETKQAEIILDMRDFGIITENGQCVVKPGRYSVSIGGCQPDERSRELTGYKTDTFMIERNGQQENITY